MSNAQKKVRNNFKTYQDNATVNGMSLKSIKKADKQARLARKRRRTLHAV